MWDETLNSVQFFQIAHYLVYSARVEVFAAMNGSDVICDIRSGRVGNEMYDGEAQRTVRDDWMR